jgi:hypothetical protein
MAYVYDYTGNLNSWDYIYNGLKDMSMMSHVMPADGWVETMNMCLATDDGSVTYKDVIYVGSERKFLSAERTMPGTVSAQLGEYSCTDHSVGKIAVSEGQTVRWGVICTGTTGWLAVVIDQVNGQNATERDSPTTNPPLDWGDTTLVYTYGGYSFVNGLEYHPNSVPSTPTQSSPSADATGVSTTPTFQGVNVHPAADSDYDSTSQVQLQIRRVSDNVIVSDTTFTPSNQAAGGTWSKVSPVSLTGGISYEWRIRHADEFGEYSGFSGSSEGLECHGYHSTLHQPGDIGIPRQRGHGHISRVARGPGMGYRVHPPGAVQGYQQYMGRLLRAYVVSDRRRA